ncbi:putative beta-glucosidase 41-like [Capsicum annuum]|nr:putative beta-glucosidase 41-like [Capsicum annuum]KAF3632887.1 putative beta-glucosidase 41-like [Capsicum annuum]
MADGEEEMKVSVGEPLPRVVFGGAPSLQEATEATSNLKHALKNVSEDRNLSFGIAIDEGDNENVLVYLSGSANKDGGSCVSGSSSSPYSKACVVSETVVTKFAPKHAMQAFRFLNESPAAHVFFSSSSFPDSDYKIDESIVDADSFSQSSRRISSSKSEAEESKFGNSFIDFLQNVTRTVTQTMVDIMNSLSDFFNNLFRGNKVFFNADGSAN